MAPAIEVKQWRPDLLKLAFRKLKIPQSAFTEKELDADRAGGDVICPRCGLKYYDHPRVEGLECLNVTCEWRVFKL